jgi:ribosome recycling factor
MANVDDEPNDSQNITIILDALKGAKTEEDRRMYTRAVARYIEQALVGLSDVASHFVDAVTARPPPLPSAGGTR